MFLIILLLYLTTSTRLIEGILHGARDSICIHDDMSIYISGCSSYGLDERCLRSQETFLVSIQYCHQSNLRYIKSLSQKVDSNKHVEHAKTEISHYLNSLHSVYIRVQIFYLYIIISHIAGEVLSHTFCKSSYKHLVSLLSLLADLFEQIVYLSLNRSDLNRRIKKSRRSDDLFSHEHLVFFLVFAWCSRYEHDLIQFLLKF